MKRNKLLSQSIFTALLSVFLLCQTNVIAKTTTVSTEAALQTAVQTAVPGDIVIVANGRYNWGSINLVYANGTSTSAWFTVKAQTVGGVVFTGSTYLTFSGNRMVISGFVFESGNSGSNDVVAFRNTSGTNASNCRLTNITINAYNSSSSTDNKWVSLYGTNNRVDHCNFINKSNAGATVVIWYDNTNYPQRSTTTQHRIDSNYFNGRSYQGTNGGETIRIGTSETSRTNGYNIVEYNLFENMTQDEPEIISNKSNFNTYRFNTIRNCSGGITLRHGRYCTVNGNFIIVNSSTVTNAYGIRVIDGGHRVFNNYIEGVNGNNGSLTSLRCPIILYNGRYGRNDTTNASRANSYFPADNCLVAFNTIVNCRGGAGIVLGYDNGGAYDSLPRGIRVGNNIIRMSSGQAALSNVPTSGYLAEGNFFSAPGGLGLSSSTGFSSRTLTFGSVTNGILAPPSIVQDVAVNSSFYSGTLAARDVLGRTRSSIFDIGAQEINATGSVLVTPLTSTVVGVGRSSLIPRTVASEIVSGGDAIKVNLYPNPASSFVQVTLNGVTPEGSTIILSDMTGRRIAQYKATNGNLYIPLKNLTQGLYNISIMSNNKVVSNKAFVIGNQ